MKLLKPRKHSFVHDIKIATPCSADWEKMTGDERKRFCGQCKLNVYNIAEMTLDEAADLIRANEGQRVCVRLYRRKDGTVITRDCPVALWRLKKRMFRMYGSVMAFAALLASWVIGESRTMGSISAKTAVAGETFPSIKAEDYSFGIDVGSSSGGAVAPVAGRMLVHPAPDPPRASYN